MSDAIISPNRDSHESASFPDRAEVLERYRRLREISRRHNSAIRKFTSWDSIMQHARRLGLARGKTLLLEDVEELTYAVDLAIHTAPAGRSRPIDRYAQSAGAPSEGDEKLMLDAMRASRFTLLRVECRHVVAGLIVADLCQDTERWLIDVGLESSIPDGAMLATRLYTPGDFSMTAGVSVPLDATTALTMVDELPQHMRNQPLDRLADDRRFAEMIYRIALANSVMDRVQYRDLPSNLE